VVNEQTRCVNCGGFLVRVFGKIEHNWFQIGTCDNPTAPEGQNGA
jgi:hypothetical protein